MAKLVLNIRQHLHVMIEYTLDCYQLETVLNKQSKQSKSVMSKTNRQDSEATRNYLFASNTLFWLGMACLEAPQHLSEPGSSEDPHLTQIQYTGMIAVRRVLEESPDFVRTLSCFENLS